MSATVNKAALVIRKWEQQSGLEEKRVLFNTLEELFTLCLETGDPPLIDRVVLEGLDEAGEHRTLVLSFQSITRRDP